MDTNVETRDIDLDRIVVSGQNTRKNLDAGQEDSSIDDLAESIRLHGLLQAVTVRPADSGTYELVAGQRRLLACKKLGLRSIRADIRTDLGDTEATAVSLIENVHRADMHPLDKAKAFAELRDHFGGDLAKVAKETGFAATTIRKYLGLLSLPVALQERLSTSEGPAKIDAMHALTKTFSSPEQMTKAYDQIGGFTQAVQKEILKRSEGDISRVPELVEQAMEGAFDVRACHGLKGRLMCEFIPEEMADQVIALVGQYKGGRLPLREIVKRLK